MSTSGTRQLSDVDSGAWKSTSSAAKQSSYFERKGRSFAATRPSSNVVGSDTWRSPSATARPSSHVGSDTWRSTSTTARPSSNFGSDTWRSPSATARPSSNVSSDTWRSPSATARPSSNVGSDTWRSPSATARTSSNVSSDTWRTPSASARPSSNVGSDTWRSPSATARPSSNVGSDTWRSPSATARPSSNVGSDTWRSPSATARPSSNVGNDTWRSPSATARSARTSSNVGSDTWRTPSASTRPSSHVDSDRSKYWRSPSATTRPSSNVNSDTWRSPSATTRQSLDSDSDTWSSSSVESRRSSHIDNTWRAPTDDSRRSSYVDNTWRVPSDASRRSSHDDEDTWRSPSGNGAVQLMSNPVSVENQSVRPIERQTVVHPVRQLPSQGTLLPLNLHTVKGANVEIGSGVITRTYTDIPQAYVFTAVPMSPGQTIVIQILLTVTDFPGNFAYGLTSCDPSTIRPYELPDEAYFLHDRPEYWTVHKPEGDLHVLDQVTFTLTSDGRVQERQNNSNPRTVMHVDATQTLWAFVDLCGAVEKVSLLTCTGTVPILPRLVVNEEFESPESANSQPERRESSPVQPKTAAIEEHDMADTECKVCFDNTVDSALYKCGHSCMCYTCALQLLHDGGGKCPLCRAEIVDVIRIFKS